MAEPSLDDFRDGYDSVASEYAQKFFGERGPGRIARFLKDRGAEVLGVVHKIT